MPLSGAKIIVKKILISFLGYKESVSLIQGVTGWIYIAVAIAALVLLFFRIDIVFYIMVVVGTIINVYVVATLSSSLEDAGIFADLIHKEPAYYMMFIGTILMIIAAVLLFLRKKN